MGESKARITERSNSYQARSLPLSDKSVSSGTFSSPVNWAVDGGGRVEPDGEGLSESPPAESVPEA